MRDTQDHRPASGASGKDENAQGAAGDVPTIPAEEEELLSRVRASQAAAQSRRPAGSKRTADNTAAAVVRRADEELVALRDEIGEARLEDVPQLVALMERLQGVALTRAALQTIQVDPSSPYFGHLRLRENVAGRGLVERDVLIGRATYVDPKSRVNVVDWRHAPVSQGVAVSCKTTIVLHRLAYLAYTYPDKFPPRRMLVVTYGAGLAAYIDQVLPALGIEGVRVLTFGDWARKELRRAVPWLKPTFVDDASPATTRVKSHPALLHELERRAEAYKGMKTSHGAVELWADLLTDRKRLFELLKDAPEMPLNEADINEAHRIMVVRVAAVVARDPRDRPPENTAEERARKRAARGARASAATDIADPSASPGHWASIGLSEKPINQKPEIELLPEGIRRVESERDDYDDEDVRGETGIDGLRTEDDQPFLDSDDVAILLRAHQLLKGVDEPLAHLFVDEAQDLSPMKLSVLIGRTAQSAGGKRGVPSITLAGDASQRLFLDTGFGDWRG